MNRLRNIGALLLGVTFSCWAVAAAVPELLKDGIAHQALFSISMNGARGYAVGAGGEVLRSEDAGQTWHPEVAPVSVALLGVAAQDQHVIAVGQMGTILIKQEGQGWKQVSSGSEERLFSVALNRHGVAIAVGAFGTLLRSIDFGETWAPSAPTWSGIFSDPAGRLGDFFEPSLYAVQLDEQNRAWVAGEVGLVLRSVDGGSTWRAVHAGISDAEGVSPTLAALSIADDGRGVAVGQEGYVLRSLDFGEHWTALPRATHANLLGVAVATNGVVLSTGMRDMLISRDGADSWEHVKGVDIATGWYSGAVVSRAGVPVAVGNAGRVVRITP